MSTHSVNTSLNSSNDRLKTALAPAVRRLSAALLLTIFTMAFFVFVAHGVVRGETLTLDRNILNALATIHSPIWHGAMLMISILAGPYFQSSFWLFWVVWFVLKQRFWPDGISMAIAGLGGLVLIVSLKYLFHRPRPQVIYDHLGYSFPSGHTFFALVIYGMAGYWMTRNLHPRHRKLIWFGVTLAIILVGFSRVALGEHYPSDVIAGYSIGFPWLWACLALPSTFHRGGRDLSIDEVSAQPQTIL